MLLALTCYYSMFHDYLYLPLFTFTDKTERYVSSFSLSERIIYLRVSSILLDNMETTTNANLMYSHLVTLFYSSSVLL